MFHQCHAVYDGVSGSLSDNKKYDARNSCQMAGVSFLGVGSGPVQAHTLHNTFQQVWVLICTGH